MRGTSSTASALTPRAASCCDDLGAVERPQVRDHERALGQRGDLALVRRRHAQDDVGAGERRGGIGHQLGAGEGVALVGESRGRARSALEADARALLAQAPDLVGGERDPPLAVCALAADGDEHAAGGLLVHGRHEGLSGSMWG